MDTISVFLPSEQNSSEYNSTYSNNALGYGYLDNTTVVQPKLNIFNGYREPLEPLSKYSLSIVIVCIILFTVFGNLLTIIAVCSQKRLQTVGNMYITSLACADLVVSSAVMTVLLLTTIIYDNWFLGGVLCDIWTFIEHVSFTASLTNVALIAWDRYNTVAWPLKALRRRTKRRAVWLILFAWLAPTIFWAAALTMARLLYGSSPEGTCYLVWEPGVFVIGAATISIYLPIIAIITLFTAMMYYLRGHMVKMNNRMKRNASVKSPEQISQSMDAPSIVTDLTNEDSSAKPSHESSSLLTSAAISISALSLDALSSFSYCDEAIMFRSLESINVDLSSKTVGTSTSPERYGLVRSIGVNTTPTYSNLPDVTKVGQTTVTRNRTRDTYHRGIKRISGRRDFHKNRYLNVDHAVWLSNRRHSVSFDSERSTSMESDEGGKGVEAREKHELPSAVVTESTGAGKTTEKSIPSNKTPVEPVVKIKLGEIGRQQSVDVDNITQNIGGSNLRTRYRNRLASLGQSGSSESDNSQKVYLKPAIKLEDAERSLSDESNESGDKRRFLKVWSSIKSRDGKNLNSSLKLPKKLSNHNRSVSEDSTESNRFLRVTKRLSQIGRTSSNESTDSRYLRVEPRVRFAHLGHSMSMESADNISIISSASHATTSSIQEERQRKTTAQMKRERYASLMRKERQTTIKQCRLRQQMKAAKTLGLIAGFLLLCWVPFAVMWPWKTYCLECLSTRMYDVAKWATSLNSAINPIIYCMCNAQFRRAFRKLVFRAKKKN